MLAAAYAVSASKWPASMLKIFIHGVSAGGVTSVQCSAAVRRHVDHAVVGADPDAVDVDVATARSRRSGPTARSARRCPALREVLADALRRSQVLRFSSGLICFQLMPLSIVFHSTLLP